MATVAFMTYPLDQPHLTRPGVLYREYDYHGSARWLAMPPESSDRMAKGDLGLNYIKNMEPRALTSPGAPFILK